MVLAEKIGYTIRRCRPDPPLLLLNHTRAIRKPVIDPDEGLERDAIVN
jgi:hypothetical protein